ncbi:DNA-binding response regulator [Virgibacillus phasianinus]|uniref:DNA-binding response regulator n=1 Tax=Virgibacillus phasianinus TaxID=2017483 RepID=A0A220U2F2_9BACI|nr:response regulator [Virgibacillus phasianinus]ASK62299.1 DNA-binding response regulator [Virgibacillus phasianinus]
MWKLLIAEDETTIRKGLRHAVNWEEYAIHTIDEAEDGEIALEMAKEKKPDILFIDINMPFLNGVELMEQLRKHLPNSIFIVITGYDEFNYAQKALKVGAFDYLLKPVRKGDLENTVKKATEQLEKIGISGDRDILLEGNQQLLKEKFLQNWCLGLSSDNEVKKQCRLLNINLEGNIGISIFKVLPEIDVSGNETYWSDTLIIFSLKNIIGDIVSAYPSAELFEDHLGNITVLIPEIGIDQLIHINREIKEQAERFLGKVIVCAEKIIDDYLRLPKQYKFLAEEVNPERNLSPMVVLAKNYIDQHYFKHTISLQEVARNVQINSTYLSKQIKNELGVSFVQYLTKVRIRKALMLMQDPYLKIYEVAEMVGYSTQHYFSNAFKKMVGISPTLYREGAMSND